MSCCPPDILLLADDFKVNLTTKSRKIFLAGVTAAKKTRLKGWMEPLNDYDNVWPFNFHDIFLPEKTTARMQIAQCSIGSACNIAADVVVSLQAVEL